MLFYFGCYECLFNECKFKVGITCEFEIEVC